MDHLKATANQAAEISETVSSVYVPPLQLTEGQRPPIAANGGLSYMTFDQDGDAGTAAATEAALIQIAEGKGQAVIDMLDNAPPGPIETKWGLGFRSYAECLEHIRANDIEAPEGGLALPLRYTIHDQPTYTIVPSNALWRDPAREADAKALRKDEEDIARRCLYFPQVMRDARRMEEYHPGLSPNSPECMDKLGLALAHCESKCEDFYDAAEVERVFYPEIEKLLLAERLCLGFARRVPPERVGRDDGVGRLFADGVAQRQRQAAFGGFDVVRPNMFQAFLVATKSGAPLGLDGAGGRVVEPVVDRLPLALGNLDERRLRRRGSSRIPGPIERHVG